MSQGKRLGSVHGLGVSVPRVGHAYLNDVLDEGDGVVTLGPLAELDVVDVAGLFGVDHLEREERLAPRDHCGDYLEGGQLAGATWKLLEHTEESLLKLRKQ